MTRTQQPLPAKVVIPSRNNDISWSTCIFHIMSLHYINYTLHCNAYFYGLFMILSRIVMRPANLDMCIFCKRCFFLVLQHFSGVLFKPAMYVIHHPSMNSSANYILNKLGCFWWGPANLFKTLKYLLLNDPSRAISTLVKLYWDSNNRVLSQILIKSKASSAWSNLH